MVGHGREARRLGNEADLILHESGTITRLGRGYERCANQQTFVRKAHTSGDERYDFEVCNIYLSCTKYACIGWALNLRRLPTMGVFQNLPRWTVAGYGIALTD